MFFFQEKMKHLFILKCQLFILSTDASIILNRLSHTSAIAIFSDLSKHYVHCQVTD